MTYQEAITLDEFRHDYQDNCSERESWNDPQLTRREFFEVWIRRNESWESLKN